jgi:alkaline phosphatase
MTGMPSQTGFVATYPVATGHDLVPVDAARAYQPLATLLEAAKIQQHKSTGLVFTCEFPHATPADCSAHSYKRGRYSVIAPQMVHNHVDVVMGGGVKYLNETYQNDLKSAGYNVYLDDIQGFRSCTKAPVWALFAETSMPYWLEADKQQTPSLAEMTRKAIDLLSKNENGFFLMVEGSKVDWAAHDNDAKNAIIEFIEFDKACGEALRFAEKDGQTVVLIVPDHGTGAVTLGNPKASRDGYDKLSLQQLMSPIDNYKLSNWSMGEKLKKADTTEWPQLIETYFGFTPQPAEITYLTTGCDYDKSPIPYEQRKNNLAVCKILSQILYNRTYFGFTTFGHTGENVFLAVYHPQNDRLMGVPTNIEVNQYLRRQMGMTDDLERLTEEIYAGHHQVFEGFDIRIDSVDKYNRRLVVKNKRNVLIADSYANYVTVNNKRVDLNSVVVYVDKTNTFYLPKELRELMLLK